MRVHRSRIDLRTPNHQELPHRKAATGAQGYPVFREPLPAVVDAVEAIRGLEETIWDVYQIPQSFSKLIFVLNAGPLLYVTVCGQGILVLNTHQVAADLLDRRGYMYSDRPRMICKGGCCLRHSVSHCYDF